MKKSFVIMLILSIGLFFNCKSKEEKTSDAPKKISEAEQKIHEDIKTAFNNWKKAFLNVEFDELLKYVPKIDIEQIKTTAKELKASIKNNKEKSEQLQKIIKNLEEEGIKTEEIDKVDDLELARKLNKVMITELMKEPEMKEIFDNFKNANITEVVLSEDKQSATIQFDNVINPQKQSKEAKAIVEDGSWKFPNN